MRILVTGSRGVLGAPLVKRLRENGHEVLGCDLDHSGDENYRRCDIANWRELRFMLDSMGGGWWPKYIINLAGEFGRKNSEVNWERVWTTNCIGTRNIIELCKNYGAKLIHASSSEAYGAERLLEVTNQEGSGWFCGVEEVMCEESVTTRFFNEYSLTKWANEKQIELSGVPAVSLRFFNVFGNEPFHPYRSVVCQFIYKMLRNEPVTVYQNMSRDFLYISDFIDSVALIPEVDFHALPPVINIGGVEGVSMEVLADMIKKLTGSSSDIFYLPAEENNVRIKKPDLTLARKYLNHDPKVSLRDGLAMTIEWMKEKL